MSDLAGAFAEAMDDGAGGLEVALEAAGRGWAVFPCGADKKPLTRHGFKDATCDPDGVRTLWEQTPSRYVGIATGSSGLVVVDLDCKNGAPGLDEWHKLKPKLGKAAEDTMLVETPSGGMHVYYRANGHKVGSTAGRLAPGIDTRAEGGYVIAAGSPGYLEVDDHGPERLRRLPALIVERMAYAETAPAAAAKDAIPEGSRDSTLASLAGTMRRRGMEADEILAALQVANARRCRPPLPDKQVVKIATSVGRYEPKAAPKLVAAQESAPPEDGIAYIDWPHFWATDHVDEEWLFQDVIALGRAHVVYAKHGVGKSLFTAYMCAKMAVEGRAVVQYLDFEMTEADLFERLDAMGYGAGTDFSRLRYALLPSLPPLDTQQGGKVLLESVDALRADFPDLPIVTVVDTLSRAVAGEEDKADTIRAFYRCCGLGLKQRGVTWMRLDHEGKNKDQGQRGTSSKGDDVDVVWQLERTQSGVSLHRKKSRMGWVPETVRFGEFYGPLRFLPVVADWPEGTAALANILDRLDVPLDAPTRAAQKRLRDVDEGRRNEFIVAALKWRRERLDDPGKHFGKQRKHPDEPKQEALPEASGSSPDLASEAPREALGSTTPRQVRDEGASLKRAPGAADSRDADYGGEW